MSGGAASRRQSGPGARTQNGLLRFRLLIALAVVPTAANATGGPASALAGLESPFVLLAAGLFLVCAVISCRIFFRHIPSSRKKWWLLLLMLFGSAVVAAIAAAVLFFPLLFLLFWLES